MEGCIDLESDIGRSIRCASGYKAKAIQRALYPDAALMVKNTAFCAAEWFVGDEKNPAVPLIYAALSQPEPDVNELKVD
jgi:hypothetical protein